VCLAGCVARSNSSSSSINSSSSMSAVLVLTGSSGFDKSKLPPAGPAPANSGCPIPSSQQQSQQRIYNHQQQPCQTSCAVETGTASPSHWCDSEAQHSSCCVSGTADHGCLRGAESSCTGFDICGDDAGTISRASSGSSATANDVGSAVLPSLPEVDFIEKIGRGSFGDVYRGEREGGWLIPGGSVGGTG
jgi:hypothetical protein